MDWIYSSPLLNLKNKANMKKCCLCKNPKILSDFHNDCTSPDGKQKACKPCQKLSNKKYRLKNKELVKIKRRERYLKSISKNKNFNKNRYSQTRDKYLNRRDISLRSVYGRLYNLFDSARSRAKKRRMIFNINLNDVIEIFEANKGKCVLTGFTFSFDRKGLTRQNPFAPSLDRIDSNKGYIKENIRLVCVIVNLALNNFGEETFEKMCRAFIENKEAT